MRLQGIEFVMKNRRSRHAKLSEYKLKQLVKCFAKDMTVKDTVEATSLSEPTVRNYFMRIRERIYEHGFIRLDKNPNRPVPAKAVFARKHRGVPEKYVHLYEAEFLHRVFLSRQLNFVRRFSANKEADLKALKKLVAYNKATPKYEFTELLHNRELPEDKWEKRPFDPTDFESSSIILVNERKIDPQESFFKFIWDLLLKHPL